MNKYFYLTCTLVQSTSSRDYSTVPWLACWHHDNECCCTLLALHVTWVLRVVCGVYT